MACNTFLRNRGLHTMSIQTRGLLYRKSYISRLDCTIFRNTDDTMHHKLQHRPLQPHKLPRTCAWLAELPNSIFRVRLKCIVLYCALEIVPRNACAQDHARYKHGTVHDFNASSCYMTSVVRIMFCVYVGFNVYSTCCRSLV